LKDGIVAKILIKNLQNKRNNKKRMRIKYNRKKPNEDEI
jgi:hypothetical protein